MVFVCKCPFVRVVINRHSAFFEQLPYNTPKNDRSILRFFGSRECPIVDASRPPVFFENAPSALLIGEAAQYLQGTALSTAEFLFPALTYRDFAIEYWR